MNQYFTQQPQPLGQNLQFQQPSYNSFQKQEVPRPDGLDGAYRLPLPSNIGSIIAVDEKRPIAYLISVNGINRNVDMYDMTPHVEERAEPVEVVGAPSQDDRIDEVLNAISALTDKVNDMEERLNEQSTKNDFGRAKSNKQWSNNESGKSNTNGSNAKSN